MTMDPNYDIPQLPGGFSGTYNTLPAPTQGGAQYQLYGKDTSQFQKIIQWAKSNPRMALTMLQNPVLAAAYGVGKWLLPYLGQYAVPTNPQQTMQNSQWMNNDPSDPFGYVGQSQGPEGAMANSIEDRIAGNIENNHPNAEIGRSWQQSAAPQYGSGAMFGPGGMSSYLLPVAGGGPPIPVIEGPKYTGAPYNPHAFENYLQNGDESWWDQWQNAPWQHGGVPGPGGMPPPPGPRNPLDPSTHISGQRGNTLDGPRNDSLNQIFPGGYGDPNQFGTEVVMYRY